ncbi:MAG: STAS domain-containing protein [Chitinivibrionales bacterium]|nr:STAS domain-containing protein [Chitinivibrionales bacterium]
MQSQIELRFQKIATRSNARIVQFIGDLDATNVENIVDEILELLNDGIVHIVADFEQLRYVNSTGLGILLHFSKSAKEKNGSFKIVNVNENVYEIIEIIGATALLEIYETIDEAVASIR